MEANDLSFLKKPLNKYIDHTLLKPDASILEFQQLLEEAVKYDFATVCVVPHLALSAKKALEGFDLDIKICTVVGFPHGNLPAPLKVQEIEYFGSLGVDEIDFVINVGLLKSELFDNFQAEMRAIDQLCTKHKVVSKCIVETCYLTEDEKTFMYKVLSEYTNIDYIKTSTGYGPTGAQLGDVMKWNAKRQEEIAREEGDLLDLNEVSVIRTKPPLKIKAAGGIRDLETALKFIACGADRLGMSASVQVMEEYNVLSGASTEGDYQTTVSKPQKK